MSDETKTAKPAYLPQVDKVLRHELLEKQKKIIRPDLLTILTRQILSSYREQKNSAVTIDQIAAEVDARVRHLTSGGLKKVINATGVILNTNLGRAPLPPSVIGKTSQALQGYSSLEIDLDTGKRGERTAFIEDLLGVLIGSEAAIVVNNNAAAVMLAVQALAWQKEVIISRGELIEIGGSFRLPDVIESAGGILKEVGATNRTRIADYRKAISSNTALILKCHKSNFAITGFTEETAVKDLVALSLESGIPLIEDLGSGALFDLSQIGLDYEPTVSSVIECGIDMVMFSCDKLLGGVQAGVVAGKRSLVEKLRKHPIYRALRADKIIIGILEGVFAQYLSPQASESIPALKMASCRQETLQDRAGKFSRLANKKLGTLELTEAPLESAFGGGTLPSQILPSWGVKLALRTAVTKRGPNISSDKLSSLLRAAPIPVIAMVTDNNLLLDFRTIMQDEEDILMAALEHADDAIRQIKGL